MFQALLNNFSGELYFADQGLDAAMKTVYANDASEYQERPMAVAIPKDEADIKKLIRFASENKVSLIPRAAGTSLAGQVVGAGIVVDISKYMNAILELNVEEQWVMVQPGVIRDDLNAYLKPYGLMFGPETATANRAMIGGMIGNNSCGQHSIVWGTTRDQLLETKVLLSDGTEAIFKSMSRQEWEAKTLLSTVEGSIYNAISELLGDVSNREHICEAFPDPEIKRRNTGYALDLMASSFPKMDGINLSTLVAGSEGTLCFVTSAKLRLMQLPPKDVAVIAVHTETIHEAMLANLIALEHGCSSSELVDDFILGFTKTHPELQANRTFIEGEPKAILMVEFHADSTEALTSKCGQFISALKVAAYGYAYPVLVGEEGKKAWEVRKAGLGLLRNIPGDARPVNLIEDCAVRPHDLPAYIAKLESLLTNFGVDYSMYAHAGAGELHVEPIINLKSEKGVRQFREILQETAALVKSFNGSLSGEHGDGRLRGEFIPMMMGDRVYEMFRDIKRIFDPQGIFNKGKIIDVPPMDTHLRYQVKTDISSGALQTATTFDFSAQGGYLRLTEKCSGSGDCRKTEVTGGTMCPSYMATRSERDTTRARANVLRQYLSGGQNHMVDREEVKEIMDLCLSCKACKSECPSSVDVSRLKGEFMQSYYDAKGVPFRTRLIAGFTTQMQWASRFSGLYNLMTAVPFFRKTINRMVGFHPNRTLPSVSGETWYQWFQQHNKQKNNSAKRLVYLFCDEFTNYNDVEIGRQAVLLIEALGYEVKMIHHPESARTYLSKGLIRKASEIAMQQVILFRDLIGEETPLIGIEPSAILGFRDEYPDLVGDQLKTDAIKIAPNALLFEEWFMQEADQQRISKDSFTSEVRKLKIHGHCHQKSIASMTSTKRALSFPARYDARLIPSGCCGMAGSFGYEQEHYDVSMKVGELVLFKTVRALESEIIIVASGTSCRHQIKDGTGRKSMHPVEVLYEALIKS